MGPFLGMWGALAQRYVGAGVKYRVDIGMIVHHVVMLVLQVTVHFRNDTVTTGLQSWGRGRVVNIVMSQTMVARLN